MSTVRDALAAARHRGVDRLDAQLLLCRELSRPRAWLLAHDETVLSAAQSDHFAALLARRAAGEPLAYLLGQKEFHGLMLNVDARVLVPRPDTELLVEWALELLGRTLADIAEPQVIDLGTGSGAIALAVRHARAAARLTATDASIGALEVAAANAARLGLPIDFATGHWWQAVAGRRFALALSNPPYIAGADAHLPALHAEPRGALTPGESGLEALDEIIAGAPSHLLPGGWLLLEHGFDQADAVQARFAACGFRDIATRQDLAGRDRCSGGHL